MQQPVQKEGHHQGGGDGGQDDGQRGHAHLGDLRQVHAEAQQNNGVLQHLFRGICNARLGAVPLPVKQGNHHARQNGEHRATHHGKCLAQHPAGTAAGPDLAF